MSHGRIVSMAGFLGAFLVLLFVASRIHVTVDFTRPCRLFPQSEWCLLKTGPDTFEASLLDRRNGNQRNYDLFRYERGDVVRFRFADELTPGRNVFSGQEIAYLESSENQIQLNRLRAEAREARAELRSVETGQKREVIELAKSEVEAAEAQIIHRESEFIRGTSLRERELISSSEQEVLEAAYRQAVAELSSAKNRLEAVQSGEKESVLATWHARVERLEQQLRDTEDKISAGHIHCPIEGTLVRLQADSALVRVADADTLYAIAPVSVSRAKLLAVGGSAAVLAGRGKGEPHDAWVVGVDDQASPAHGRDHFWVMVATPNPEGRLVAGTRSKLRFHGPEVSLLGWLADRVRHAGDSSL